MTDETTTGGEEPQDEGMPPVNYLTLGGKLEGEGEVGGESQAVYAFHAVEGQSVTVSLTPEGSKASFYVSRGANYYNAEGLELGAQGEGNGPVSFTAPKTGLYFVGVVAEVGEVPSFVVHVTLK